MTSSVYKERARKAFDYADAESAGSLTKRQYKIAMTAAFGYCPDKVKSSNHSIHTKCLRKVSNRSLGRRVPPTKTDNFLNTTLPLQEALLDIEVGRIFRIRDRIFYNEFERRVLEKSSANHTRVNSEMLFALLDKNYKGYLVMDDFYLASSSVDLNVLPSVWEMVFKELDRRKKGYLDLDEFSNVLPAI